MTDSSSFLPMVMRSYLHDVGIDTQYDSDRTEMRVTSALQPSMYDIAMESLIERIHQGDIEEKLQAAEQALKLHQSYQWMEATLCIERDLHDQ